MIRSRGAAWRSVRANELRAEQLRPELTGDQEGAIGRVVGDTVEHVGALTLCWREQASRIDDSVDLPAGRVDPEDHIGLPYVGVHAVADALELVELVNRATLQTDVNTADDGEAFWVSEGEAAAAIRHD